MGWTWREIESDWLAGGGLADPPEVVVAAFNRVTEFFGRKWIAESRIAEAGGEIRGTSPTLRIVMMGKLLSIVTPLPGSGGLVAKLAERRSDAYAEAMALYLLLQGQHGVRAEVEPTVTIGTHHRKPDGRVRRATHAWTYVEVARPENSEAHRRVEAKGKRLIARAAEPTLVPYAIEVFLRREPSEEELPSLEQRVREVSRRGSRREQVELADDLGVIFLNITSPMQPVLEDHGEIHSPRIGLMHGLSGGNQVPRHIVVRVPFSDDRADEFLRSEARQLPKDDPGLIMISTSGATGAINTWEAVLRRRFQPVQYTRVSAICLFQGGQESTDAGEALVPHTRLILNPHARQPLASWIEQSLRRYESAGLS